MPGVYDAAYLAGYFSIYAQKKADSPAVSDAVSSLLGDWTLLAESQKGDPRFFEQFGYAGLAFINSKGNEIVISHRGTKINFSKMDESSANLISDSSIASQNIPFESELAVSFTQFVIDSFAERNKHIRIVQVGHSLGGVHAHLCGLIFRQPVIAFDNPGCRELIQALPVVDFKNQINQHVSFLSTPNIINCTNQHFGIVYQLKESQSEKGFFQSVSFPLMTHRLKYLMSKIPKDMKDPTLGEEITDVLFYQWKQTDFNSNKVTEYSIQNDKLSPQIEISEEPGGYVTYEMQSKLVKSKKVNQNYWIVSHMNSGSVWTGHSIIIVEGVKIVDDKPEAFIGYYHLIVPKDSNDGMIACETFRFHRYQHRYDLHKTVSWRRPASTVRKMIEAIETERGKTIAYHFAGSNSLLWSTDGKHNCTSWANEKLKMAEIDISSPIISVFDLLKTKPGVHTTKAADSDLPANSGSNCLLI